MKDIELINTMISRLKNLKSTIQKKEKLSIQRGWHTYKG